MPKRTRAIKATDRKADKPWLKRMNPNTYRLETRVKQKTILIVCEGQTEELYFKSFPVVTAKVKSIQTGFNAEKLVDCAIGMKEPEYDEVWCVFDRDIKPDIEDQAQGFDNAISKAEAAGIQCAYSNDAFELWYVLHYQYIDQQQLRTFYFERLGYYWNMNYGKEGKTYIHARAIYSRLEEDPHASQSTAITRACKLHIDQINKPFHQQNPVTTVYALVNELNKHLRP